MYRLVGRRDGRVEPYGVVLGGTAVRADLGSSSNYSGEIQLLKRSVSNQLFEKLII